MKTLGTPHAPALQRGLALLQELATRPNGASQSELAALLKLPQTAVHRIAAALEHLGYVQKHASSRTLRVTQKLLLLGQPHSGSRSLIEACIPALRNIARLTGETTQLCVLAEAQCVILEHIPSRHPFKYVVDLGSRAPTQCCAPGKAMLAFLPEPELSEAIDRLHFHPHTENSLLCPADLLEELKEVRSLGYALDRAEHFEGIHCIAAPLLDAHGRPFAAITIAGPSSRIPQSAFSTWGGAISSAASDAALQFLL
ncbi:MAG: IclR family [Verrucomicrobia bacterium]|nr:MAG: IclR family [Verrucomicrobiota bacterium]